MRAHIRKRTTVAKNGDRKIFPKSPGKRRLRRKTGDVICAALSRSAERNEIFAPQAVLGPKGFVCVGVGWVGVGGGGCCSWMSLEGPRGTDTGRVFNYLRIFRTKDGGMEIGVKCDNAVVVLLFCGPRWCSFYFIKNNMYFSFFKCDLRLSSVYF